MKTGVIRSNFEEFGSLKVLLAGQAQVFGDRGKCLGVGARRCFSHRVSVRALESGEPKRSKGDFQNGLNGRR